MKKHFAYTLLALVCSLSALQAQSTSLAIESFQLLGQAGTTDFILFSPVVIVGEGFSATASENKVAFGNDNYVDAYQYHDGSPSVPGTTPVLGSIIGKKTIFVEVPSHAAASGKIKVKVGDGGTVVESTTDYTFVAFSVTSVSPETGGAGDLITIVGTGFKRRMSTSTAAPRIKFGKSKHVHESLFTEHTPTKLQLRVPLDATGKIKFTFGRNTEQVINNFTTIPFHISSFSPSSNVNPGDDITITGTGFSENNQYVFSFGGTVYNVSTPATAYTRDSETQITVTVPSNASTGRIFVRLKSNRSAEAEHPCYLEGFSTPAPSFTLIGSVRKVGHLERVFGTNFSPILSNNKLIFSRNTSKFNDESFFVTPLDIYPNPSNSELSVMEFVMPTKKASGGGDIRPRLQVNLNDTKHDVGYGGTILSAANALLIPPHTVAGVSPSSVGPGETITIRGTEFSVYAPQNIVVFPTNPRGSSIKVQAQSVTVANVMSSFYQGTEIKVKVPYGAVTGRIKVRIGARTVYALPPLSIPDVTTADKFPDPIIQSISPTFGPVGTVITITGSNFSTTVANNTVTFNGCPRENLASDCLALNGHTFNYPGKVDATVVTASATELQVTVPADAESGTITVSVTGAANSFTFQQAFTVGDGMGTGSGSGSASGTSTAGTCKYTADPTSEPDPTISSINPITGDVGSTVTITGTNFSTTSANNTVTFLGGDGLADNQGATITSVSATSLVVTVPNQAQTGPIQVTVQGASNLAQSSSFTVMNASPPPTPEPDPTISSINPASGAVGTAVTITGTNFSATLAKNTVTFLGGDGLADNRRATVTSASTTELAVTVPNEAQTGHIEVTIEGANNSVQSPSSFTVTSTGGSSPGYFSIPTPEEESPQMYPNPVSDQLHFEGLLENRSYTYQIYTIIGKQVLSGTFRGNEIIDLSSLSAAQYVISLRSENGREIIRRRLLLIR